MRPYLLYYDVILIVSFFFSSVFTSTFIFSQSSLFSLLVCISVFVLKRIFNDTFTADFEFNLNKQQPIYRINIVIFSATQGSSVSELPNLMMQTVMFAKHRHNTVNRHIWHPSGSHIFWHMSTMSTAAKVSKLKHRNSSKKSQNEYMHLNICSILS